MRYFFLAYIVIIIAVVATAGFRGTKFALPPIELFSDMDHQPKVDPQEDSDFFAINRAAQEPILGTIPMGWDVPAIAASEGAEPVLDGYGFANDYLNTGKMGEFFGHGIPEELEIDADFLARGQEMFAIHCTICHGASGNGAGVISKYGLQPTSLITPPVSDPTLRPDGNIYDVIVHGKGLMGPYGANLTLRDRWAVVAYVRALQERTKMPAAEAAEAFDLANQPAP